MIMPQPYLHHANSHPQQMPIGLVGISGGGEIKEFKCPYFDDCKKSFSNTVCGRWG